MFLRLRPDAMCMRFRWCHHFRQTWPMKCIVIHKKRKTSREGEMHYVGVSIFGICANQNSFLSCTSDSINVRQPDWGEKHRFITEQHFFVHCHLKTNRYKMSFNFFVYWFFKICEWTFGQRPIKAHGLSSQMIPVS